MKVGQLCLVCYLSKCYFLLQYSIEKSGDMYMLCLLLYALAVAYSGHACFNPLSLNLPQERTFAVGQRVTLECGGNSNRTGLTFSWYILGEGNKYLSAISNSARRYQSGRSLVINSVSREDDGEFNCHVSYQGAKNDDKILSPSCKLNVICKYVYTNI